MQGLGLVPPASIKGHLVDLKYAFWFDSGKYDSSISMSLEENIDKLQG